MKPSHRKPTSLNPQQERFCQEYLKDLNATQAAIRSKYSEKTAHSQGPRLLDHVGVRARIQELMDARAKRVEVTTDFVLGELLKLASVDLSKAYDEMGSLLPIHEIPKETRMAIAGIETIVDQDGGVTKKIKLWDKPRSLELLGKNLKLFTDKVEHSGKIDLESKSDEELDTRIKELMKK